jgi:hypothetical protein
MDWERFKNAWELRDAAGKDEDALREFEALAGLALDDYRKA